jgi:hypothetical protein
MGLFRSTIENFKMGIREWLNKTQIKGDSVIFASLPKPWESSTAQGLANRPPENRLPKYPPRLGGQPRDPGSEPIWRYEDVMEATGGRLGPGHAPNPRDTQDAVNRQTVDAYREYADVQERIYEMQQLIEWLQRACAHAQAYTKAIHTVQLQPNGVKRILLVPVMKSPLLPALDATETAYGLEKTTIRGPHGQTFDMTNVRADVISRHNPEYQHLWAELEAEIKARSRARMGQ